MQINIDMIAYKALDKIHDNNPHNKRITQTTHEKPIFSGWALFILFSCV